MGKHHDSSGSSVDHIPRKVGKLGSAWWQCEQYIWIAFQRMPASADLKGMLLIFSAWSRNFLPLALVV